MALALAFDIILLIIFIQIRIIFPIIRRIDFGVMDMDICVHFIALKQCHHCTCTVGCDTIEAVQKVGKDCSFFQTASALAHSGYVMHFQFIAKSADNHTKRCNSLCLFFVII